MQPVSRVSQCREGVDFCRSRRKIRNFQGVLCGCPGRPLVTSLAACRCRNRRQRTVLRRYRSCGESIERVALPIYHWTRLHETAVLGRFRGGGPCSESGRCLPARRVYSRGRAITPRSARPLTKYCAASATSSSPMMRTRMRIPVSPSRRTTLLECPRMR